MRARLYIDVEFDEQKTDTESVAAALDKVMSNGLATLLDCWDDYGGEPRVGRFLVMVDDGSGSRVAEHEDDTGEVEMRWRNRYRCPDCGEEWEDSWDSQCDDDCPHCGCRHVSPYESKEVEEE